MKQIFIFAMLVGMCCAITLNTTDIANKTYIMDGNGTNIYYISDLNTTFYFVMQNTTIQLNASQNYTSLNNITILAPPKLHQTIWLNETQNYTHTDLNLTIFRTNCTYTTCAPCNTSSTCPTLNCMQNISTSLAFGGIYFSAITNTTIYAPTKEYLNITRALLCGENYANIGYGIFISSPICSPSVKYNTSWTPNFGEYFSIDEINVSCKAPDFPTIDRNDTLYPNQTTGYGRYNLTAICLPCQSGYNYVPKYANCSTNQSFSLDNNVSVSFCADSVRTLCSDSEILDGNIKGCITRMIFELNISRESWLEQAGSYQSQFQNCTNVVNGWEGTLIPAQKQSEILIMFLVIVCGVFGVYGLANIVLKSKEKKEVGK